MSFLFTLDYSRGRGRRSVFGVGVWTGEDLVDAEYG